MRFERIESPRLVLRRFRKEDLPTFLEYRNDPEVARYQSWESISEREAIEFLHEMDNLEPGLHGHWFQFAIERKDDGRLIGDCALRVEGAQWAQGEIGYTLAREHQGNGYATEAVSRLLEYAFGELELHRVFALTDCRNDRSTELLNRVGMRREGHFVRHTRFKGDWCDEYLFAMLLEEWKRRRAQAAP